MLKASLSRSENDISLTMGFSKVDKENRRVRGFATFDNVDRQGDIVLSDASVQAFSQFAGNIREMHDKTKAVGKMVAFDTVEHFDSESGKVVKGILVDVYVSKGAQDTWEKVLDGTLAGFSIGGKIEAAENVYDPDSGNNVRVIKGYRLTELSLVDSPANQMANVVSIVKVDAPPPPEAVANAINTTISDHTLITDPNNVTFGLHYNEMFKSDVENVLYCGKDDVTILSKSESSSCPVCSEPMSNIGWVQKGSGEAEMIKSLLAKIRKSETYQENGGIEEMADVNAETAEATEEVAKSEDATEAVASDATETPTEEVEKSEVAEETSEAGVEKSEETAPVAEADSSEVLKSMEAVASTLESLTKAIEAMSEKFAKGVDGISEKVSEVEATAKEVEKRLTDVEDHTAVKKSAEVGPSEDGEIQKSQDESFWGGLIVTR